MTMKTHFLRLALLLAFIIGVNGERAASIDQPSKVNTTNTKPYSMRITKYLCVGTPNKRTKLEYCKTILRRNKPTALNVSLTVPEVLNHILLKVRLYYKFNTYQPFLIDGEEEACQFMRNPHFTPVSKYVFEVMRQTVPDLTTHCPHGNRTYAFVWWLEERYTPRSVPAGDYRLDIYFTSEDNVVLFALEVYMSARRAGVFGSMLEW